MVVVVGVVVMVVGGCDGGGCWSGGGGCYSGGGGCWSGGDGCGWW